MTTNELLSNVLCDEEIAHCNFLADEGGIANQVLITYRDGSVGSIVRNSSDDWELARYKHYQPWC